MGMSPVRWHRPAPSRGSTRRSSTRTSRPSPSSRRGFEGLPEAFAQAAASKPGARSAAARARPLPIEREPCTALAPPSKAPAPCFRPGSCCGQQPLLLLRRRRDGRAAAHLGAYFVRVRRPARASAGPGPEGAAARNNWRRRGLSAAPTVTLRTSSRGPTRSCSAPSRRTRARARQKRVPRRRAPLAPRDAMEPEPRQGGRAFFLLFYLRSKQGFR